MKPLPPSFEHWIRPQLGNEYTEFLASLEESPPVSIRVHPVKNVRSQEHQPVPWTNYGQYLPFRPVFTLDPLFHGGSYYVQEASSMFLEQALRQSVDLKESLNVLDLCAAPGGKSTHILSLLNRDSLLVANETIRSRAVVLSENLQKWGYPNSIVTNNDPADFKKLEGFFDVVVVDAPCSGEGLFRKEPEAMDEWSPGNVQLCAARQKRIIAEVWNALRANGTFIYCTCTYNSLENEDNLRWLAASYDVESVRLKIDPAWGIEEVETNGLFGYRFFPHKVSGEGFFIAVLRKGDTDVGAVFHGKAKKSIATPLKKLCERLEPWIADNNESTFFQFNDLIFYTPASKAQEIEFLLQSLRILYAGTNMASVKHDKLVPDHAMALSVELEKNSFPLAEVNLEQALRYLRRETIHLNSSSGFTLVTYEDRAIGWVNVLPNRVNNMYPSEWRIRM